MSRSCLRVAAALMLTITATGCDTSGPDPQYEFPWEITESIWLSDEPGSIGLLPGGELLLVLHSFGYHFEVVDLQTLTSLGEFSAGTFSEPVDFAIHPTEPLVYFCDDDWFLSVVETDSFEVVDSVWIGGNINNVCLDSSGEYILATDHIDDLFYVLDAQSDSIISTASVPAIPSGDLVYVERYSAAYIACGSTVVALSVPDATELATIQVGEYSEGICVLPSEEYAYVVGQPLTVVRLSDNTAVDSIPELSSGYAQITCLPEGDYLYSGSSIWYLGVVNTQTNEVAAEISLQEYNLAGLAVSLDGTQVYVAVDGHQIFVLE